MVIVPGRNLSHIGMMYFLFMGLKIQHVLQIILYTFVGGVLFITFVNVITFVIISYVDVTALTLIK